MGLERLLSLPAILIGGGLIYVGSFEVDVIYLFFYIFLGSSITLLGILLLMGRGLASKSKKKKIVKVNEAITEIGQPEVTDSEYCPGCGASILSAGKFCGRCGREL